MPEKSREAPVSAVQDRPEAPARVPRPPEVEGRPPRARQSPVARPQAPLGLTSEHLTPGHPTDGQLSVVLGRLRTRPEFLYVADGRSWTTPGLMLQARARPPESPVPSAAVRCGFTASKKVGNAVVRNRAKRRLRDVARRVLAAGGAPGTDYVLVARMDTATRDFTALLADAALALEKVSRPGAPEGRRPQRPRKGGPRT